MSIHSGYSFGSISYLEVCFGDVRYRYQGGEQVLEDNRCQTLSKAVRLVGCHIKIYSVYLLEHIDMSDNWVRQLLGFFRIVQC